MISFLTGLVLTLLAIYLAIMIGSCLVGFYFVKKLVKDDDKEQNEVVYSICDCNHLFNNDNIRSYMMYCSMFIIGVAVIGYLAYLGMKATGAL